MLMDKEIGMRMPFVVAQLDPELVRRWNVNYASGQDRRWDVEEGLWRRTQHPDNATESGWTGPDDARRRILHYRYRFDVYNGVLRLADFYLLMSVAAPAEELVRRTTAVMAALESGSWTPAGGQSWSRGNLVCRYRTYGAHPRDIDSGRTLPDSYRCADLMIRSDRFVPDDALDALPWQVLDGGMRAKDQRGAPRLVPDLASLTEYLPFQVEVGCGMSMEAGVPALHRLHEIYQVTDRESGAFVLRPDEDSFAAWLLADPDSAMPTLTDMFYRCLLAEPTAGYRALRALAEAGHLVGPVITNNFDGLAVRAGLQQCYVRRYDEAVPPVPWEPSARSLLVVGSHADRRKVQERARKRGLKVFYLDPEGYWEKGQFVSYPIEGVRDSEVLCRRPAGAALTELAALLQCGAAEEKIA
ncbi:SIR2 family protein [Nocardia stercoris]|uniref:hypothetical protein n=1 Tax=Nocardia stercoris TaxID=2483361 RepID=UPI0018F3B4CD|nr:hypothetical protein [Nocardia stercoris]